MSKRIPIRVTLSCGHSFQYAAKGWPHIAYKCHPCKGEWRKSRYIEPTRAA